MSTDTDGHLVPGMQIHTELSVSRQRLTFQGTRAFCILFMEYASSTFRCVLGQVHFVLPQSWFARLLNIPIPTQLTVPYPRRQTSGEILFNFYFSTYNTLTLTPPCQGQPLSLFKAVSLRFALAANSVVGFRGFLQPLEARKACQKESSSSVLPPLI